MDFEAGPREPILVRSYPLTWNDQLRRVSRLPRNKLSCYIFPHNYICITEHYYSQSWTLLKHVSERERAHFRANRFIPFSRRHRGGLSKKSVYDSVVTDVGSGVFPSQPCFNPREWAQLHHSFDVFLCVAYRQQKRHRLTLHHICIGNTSVAIRPAGLHSR